MILGKPFKGPVAIAAGLSVLVAVFAIVHFVSFIVWSDRMESDLSRLSLSDARLPVTLTVFGRSTDTISARLAFYTADGDLAGTLERSWSGWEIKIDCILVGSGKSWMAFPFLIYTDSSLAGSGVDLVRYYDRNGFPAIYESARISPVERKSMKRLFSLVRTEHWMPSLFGSLAHRTVSLRSFEAGREYSLFVARDGSLRFSGN